MNTRSTPDNTENRAEKRRRAGVHAAWIWGGILALLLVIYLTAHAIAGYSASRSWIKSINSALKQRDAEKAAALLTACRREMPALAQKPFFAVWQSQLLALQEENARRSAQFEKKIADFQLLLDSGDAARNHSALSLELAEIARYASTAEELERLRTLQRHCEAIERIKALENSQGGVMQLRKLSADITAVKKFRQTANFERCRQLGTQCEKLISSLLLEFEHTPEIAEQIIKMRTDLQQELAANAHDEKSFARCEQEFQYVLTGNYTDEISRRAQDFLRKHSSSSQAAQVKSLLSALEFTAQPQLQSAAKHLEEMQKRSNTALQFWSQTMKKIMAQSIRGTVFELVLQIPQTDNGGRAASLTKRFETYEKCSFSPPDESGRISIRFQDVNGKIVSGKFTADGNGEIITPDGSYRGRYLRGEVRGELPTARWQDTLYALYWDVEQKKDFPVYLTDTLLPTLTGLPDYVLPEELKKHLLAAAFDAEKILQTSVEQFIFEREIFSFAVENQPIFTGLLHFPADRAKYIWSTHSPTSAQSLYLLDLQRPNPWVLIGTKQTPVFPAAIDKHNIYVLFSVDSDIKAQMQKWRQTAAEKNLKIPANLPNTLRF